MGHIEQRCEKVHYVFIAVIQVRCNLNLDQEIDSKDHCKLVLRSLQMLKEDLLIDRSWEVNES